MKVMKSNSRKITIGIITTLILLIGTITSYAFSDKIIIAPKQLEGVPGTRVESNDVFVQRVTTTKVTNISKIELRNESGQPITHFTTKPQRAVVRDIDGKVNLGYITLQPITIEGEAPLESNLKGEFLYYQEGKVFNSLSSAGEGRLYFWREPKSGRGRPMILDIGEIKNNIFHPMPFVNIGNTITVRRE